MKKVLYALLLSFIPFMAPAQEQDSLQLYGWPKDAFTQQPVIDGGHAVVVTGTTT